VPPITPGASVTLDPSASGGSTEGFLFGIAQKETKRLVFFIGMGRLRNGIEAVLRGDAVPRIKRPLRLLSPMSVSG